MVLGLLHGNNTINTNLFICICYYYTYLLVIIYRYSSHVKETCWSYFLRRLLEHIYYLIHVSVNTLNDLSDVIIFSYYLFSRCDDGFR